MIWEKMIKELMEALMVEMHIRECKECKKKYLEILKHAKEEYKEK